MTPHGLSTFTDIGRRLADRLVLQLSIPPTPQYIELMPEGLHSFESEMSITMQQAGMRVAPRSAWG